MKTIFALLVLVAALVSGLPETYRFAYQTSNRVVGGKEAIPHSAPYIVSLQKTELFFFRSHFCGGTLIAPNVVLTAGHCIVYAANSIEVLAGAHDNGGSESTAQWRKGSKAIVHSQFSSASVGPYDIAVIILEKPFDLNEFISVAPLPNADAIPKGEVTLYGWGKTENATPKKLHTVTKPIIPYEDCKKVIPDAPVEPSNICTGPLTGGVSGCSGDSGGPLVQTNTKGIVEIVGLTSWGFTPCGAANHPTIYTRISAYIEWIKTAANL